MSQEFLLLQREHPEGDWPLFSTCEGGRGGCRLRAGVPESVKGPVSLSAAQHRDTGKGLGTTRKIALSSRASREGLRDLGGPYPTLEEALS